MKTYLNKAAWKTRCDHASDAVGRPVQGDRWQSRIPWLWCNLNQEWHKSDENQDLHTHKAMLVGHHDHNWETHNSSVETELSGHVCCRNECRSPDSVETLFSTWRMLLNKDLSKSARHWYIRDTNRSTNAKASTSSCPRNRNKQMAEKQNRSIWSVCPSSEMTSEISKCLSSDSVSSSAEAK